LKLISFFARGVHGYLDFDLKFNPDVNFIAGVNGSGKTTALNIIAAILTPSLEELSKVHFEAVKLKLQLEDSILVSISAEQSEDFLYLNLFRSDTGMNEALSAGIQELRHTVDRSVTNKFRSHPALKYISSLPSPMYLSLDRRFIKEVAPFDPAPLGLSVFFDKGSRDDKDVDSSMKEALDLILKKSAEIKDKQAHEDRKLRNKIILDSFYVEADEVRAPSLSLPNKTSLQQLKKKQVMIKNALINLDFKDEGLDVMYDRFFENLNSILKNVLDSPSSYSNQVDYKRNTATQRRKDSDYISSSSTKKIHSSDIAYNIEYTRALARWFSNSHQIARIDRLINLIMDYEQVRDDIYLPISKFANLVNLFLEQTGKRIVVTNRGEVRIFISEIERPLTVLSSGERQIIIMLAHLSLNGELPKSGVFIVDEPELSLHVAWQDMFLEAVQAAGPDLQIILATHSPAIIGGRNNFYVPLNGGI
jgi:predicted ATP-binding protein involved in virulence